MDDSERVRAAVREELERARQERDITPLKRIADGYAAEAARREREQKQAKP